MIFWKSALVKTNDKGTAIKELEENEADKYLRIQEINGIKHKEIKEKFRKEFYRRTRGILCIEQALRLWL